MSITHNISVAYPNQFAHQQSDHSGSIYSQSGEGDQIDYCQLYNSIASYHYAAYVERLEAVGHQRPPSDYYYSIFGECTPSSFVVDRRSRPILRPGHNKLWLVFVVRGGMGSSHMFVAKYLVCGDGVLSMYGDGPLGLRVNMGGGDINVAGVSINVGSLERVLSGGRADVRVL